MADQEYNLIYKGNNTDILAKSNVVIRLLRLLDSIADRLIAKLPKLFKDAGKAAGSATPKITATAKALDLVASSATTASSSVATVTTTMIGASAAIRGTAAASRQATTHAQGLSSGMMGISTAALGMRVAREAFDALRDAVKEARDYLIEAVKEQEKLNDLVRELRAIKGGDTTTKDASDEVKKLMLASGGTAQEMVAFDVMWESAISASKQSGNWKLSDKDTDEVKTQAARFAVANAIDPATVGKMVPSIGAFEPVKTPADVLSQLGMMHGMGVEAVGRFSPVMKDYQKLVGQMVRPGGGGAASSSAELMAIISAATVTSGTEARAVQDVSQVWRELSVPKNDAQHETFRKYGLIPGKDNYPTAVEKIAPLLLESRKAGHSDLETLQQAGFHNAGANAKIIAAVNNRLVTRDRFDRMSKAGDPGAVAAISDQFQRENPARFAERAAEVAKMSRAGEMDDVKVLRQFAEAGMDVGKEINTSHSNVKELLLDIGTLHGMTGDTGRSQILDKEIRQRLLALVPGIEKKFPSLASGMMSGTTGFGTVLAGGALAGTAGGNAPEGADLEKIIDSLPAAQREALYRDLTEFSRTGKRGPGVPAKRNAVPGAPVPGGPAPGVPGGGNAVPAGPQALNDAIQFKQLQELQALRRAVTQNQARQVRRGPLPSDVDESGSVRT